MGNVTINELIEKKQEYFKKHDIIITKNFLVNEFTQAISNIEDNVIPTLEAIITNVETNGKKFLTPQEFNKVKLVGGILKYTKYKKDDVYGFIKDCLLVNLKALVLEEGHIKNAITNNMNTRISPVSINIKDLNILNFVDNIVFVATFALDFLDLVIESVKVNTIKGYEMRINKKILESITNNLGGFLNISSSLNKAYIQMFIKELPKSSTSIVSELENQDQSLANKVIKDTGGTPDMLSKFGITWNPVYDIRMKIQEWQHDRYLAMKEKRDRYKLEIMKLELDKNGQNDIELDKSIEWYREKEEELARKIAKYEQSV